MSNKEKVIDFKQAQAKKKNVDPDLILEAKMFEEQLAVWANEVSKKIQNGEIESHSVVASCIATDPEENNMVSTMLVFGIKRGDYLKAIGHAEAVKQLISDEFFEKKSGYFVN